MPSSWKDAIVEACPQGVDPLGTIVLGSHCREGGNCAYRRRKADERSALYWGCRQGEPGGEPQVGDLVAYSRVPGTNAARAARLFHSTASYPSHSDLVVATGPGFIEVIGCNVRDSVTLKRLPTNAAGHIADAVHAWFAVLKLRAS
jgi:hypothetical protein